MTNYRQTTRHADKIRAARRPKSAKHSGQPSAARLEIEVRNPYALAQIIKIIAPAAAPMRAIGKKIDLNQ